MLGHLAGISYKLLGMVRHTIQYTCAYTHSIAWCGDCTYPKLSYMEGYIFPYHKALHMFCCIFCARIAIDTSRHRENIFLRMTWGICCGGSGSHIVFYKEGIMNIYLGRCGHISDFCHICTDRLCVFCLADIGDNYRCICVRISRFQNISPSTFSSFPFLSSCNLFLLDVDILEPLLLFLNIPLCDHRRIYCYTCDRI